MSAAFKVKIEDGSIVGPLDMAMLKSWFAQGLINRDTPVLSPGSRRWGRLHEVMDVGIDLSKGSSRKRAKQRAAEAAAEDEPAVAGSGGRIVAGGALIVFAAAAVAAHLLPTAWRPDLTPAPWTELAFGWVLLGLLSLHGSEWARKFARAGVGASAFALFPVAGLLIAQRVPMEALAVVAFAWLAASGLFFLLSPSLPGLRVAIAALVVVAGAAGVFRFGIVPEVMTRLVSHVGLAH